VVLALSLRQDGFDAKRRSFLNWIIGVSGSIVGAFIAYPVIRYIIPPSIPEAATRRVNAAKKDELAPGSFKIFPFGSQPAILIRLSDGGYRAFTAVCTHLGCTVQFRKTDNLIWCACHNGVYNLQGGNVSGPPPKPLAQFTVHVTGDDVVVEKAAAS